jgi:hypothetical protein
MAIPCEDYACDLRPPQISPGVSRVLLRPKPSFLTSYRAQFELIVIYLPHLKCPQKSRAIKSPPRDPEADGPSAYTNVDIARGISSVQNTVLATNEFIPKNDHSHVAFAKEDMQESP